MWDELPFIVYDFRLHSIRNNDVKAVEMTLGVVNGDQIRKLLNGKFIFPDSGQKQNDSLDFTRAWSVALSCASYDVIRSFVKHGVDPCLLDREENNALHVLVHAAFNKPDEKEKKIRDVYAYIQTLIFPEIILRLLLLDKKSLKYKGTEDLFESDLIRKWTDGEFRATAFGFYADFHFLQWFFFLMRTLGS